MGNLKKAIKTSVKNILGYKDKELKSLKIQREEFKNNQKNCKTTSLQTAETPEHKYTVEERRKPMQKIYFDCILKPYFN